eukprot:TRINITY_DN4018_c0_g2_i1.p1 TRINITY_DN4018_c0_g2~~TRINITY_DN4018_c0_g2_i1.p1  ORF type:complete len:837 (-),score=177.31 TRINITY_DN4018_c0_g2_i1:36-2546(-)
MNPYQYSGQYSGGHPVQQVQQQQQFGNYSPPVQHQYFPSVPTAAPQQMMPMPQAQPYRQNVTPQYPYNYPAPMQNAYSAGWTQQQQMYAQQQYMQQQQMYAQQQQFQQAQMHAQMMHSLTQQSMQPPIAPSLSPQQLQPQPQTIAPQQVQQPMPTISQSPSPHELSQQSQPQNTNLQQATIQPQPQQPQQPQPQLQPQPQPTTQASGQTTSEEQQKATSNNEQIEANAPKRTFTPAKPKAKLTAPPQYRPDLNNPKDRNSYRIFLDHFDNQADDRPVFTVPAPPSFLQQQPITTPPPVPEMRDLNLNDSPSPTDTRSYYTTANTEPSHTASQSPQQTIPPSQSSHSQQSAPAPTPTPAPITPTPTQAPTPTPVQQPPQQSPQQSPQAQRQIAPQVQKEPSLSQLQLPGTPRKAEDGNEHDFYKISTTSSANCGYCKEVIMSDIASYKCRGCQFPIHKECLLEFLLTYPRDCGQLDWGRMTKRQRPASSMNAKSNKKICDTCIYIPESFAKPVYCFICDNIIWGFSKKGAKCKVCHQKIHESCAPNSRQRATTSKNHNMKLNQFNSPTWCKVCGDFIWGITKQGYLCLDCHLSCHKKCLPQVTQARDCGKTLYRSKVKKSSAKQQQTKVFGVPLDDVLNQAGNENFDIPTIVFKAIQEIEANLDQEGLFRLSPKQTDVAAIREAIDSGQSASVNFKNYNEGHYLAASVIKLFIRELPEPLLSKELLPSFLAISEQPPMVRETNLRNLIRRLPIANQTLLCSIVDLLQKVAAQSEKNKMNVNNIITIFAPLLFPTLKQGSTALDNSLTVLQETTEARPVLTLLLEKQVEIFGKKDVDK